MINPITPILEIGKEVIKRVFPDPQQRAQAELELFKMEQTGELAQITERSKIIVAEAQSESWLARNWRPIIMLLFGAIIFNNYLLIPWLKTFGLPAAMMPIPPNMWSLLEIGMGGYVFGRTLEKGIKAWKK